VAGPRIMKYFIRIFPADLNRSVGAAAIDNNNLVRPPHTLQAVADIGLFVEGDDRD